MEVFEASEISNNSYSFDEGGRGCRTKKRQVDPICCPVCSVTIRPTEIDSHLHLELEKLSKIPAPKIRHNGKSSPSCSNGASSSSKSNPNKNWETYQKIRNNRQTRQRTKTRKRKAEDEACPICNQYVAEDLPIHVEICLRKSERNNSDEDDIDIESFEEYEWAGQNRIRTTSLLPGGAAFLGQTVQLAEDDEDLNVDGVAEDIFGAPQYSEKDIILPCEGGAEELALRKAVTGAIPNCLATGDQEMPEQDQMKGDPVLQVLKNRIKELEARLDSKNEVYKCLICMERYQTPVISVCCWHVHCEKCWLQTLGAKKLCPQCNMITSATDLRKIYI